MEDEKAVKEKKDRLKKWKQSGIENDKAEYKSAKSTAKRVVACVKSEAVEGLSENFDTREDRKDIIYKIAAARDLAANDRTSEYMQSIM